MKVFREGQLNHQENQKWLRQLDFYEDELRIFQKELNMVIGQHPNLLSIVEHVQEYQDIFKKKGDRIKELKDNIAIHEKSLVRSMELSYDEIWEQSELWVEISNFVQAIEELKANFRRFVAKNGFPPK